jgi:vacuolar-type H+-ATPase subunit H
MGLFDAVREKAAELLSGATEKVSELTGTDLADAQQNATDTAQNVGETAQGHVDTVSGAGQDLAGTATDSVQNVSDTATGAVADSPAGEYLDPRGQ